MPIKSLTDEQELFLRKFTERVNRDVSYDGFKVCYIAERVLCNKFYEDGVDEYNKLQAVRNYWISKYIKK
jgi:hypothetical protein